MDAVTLLLVELVVFAASLVGGLTGFGFALVLAPNLMLLISPKEAVPVVALLSVVLNLLLFYESRAHARPGEIKMLVVSGLAGTVIGSVLLVYINVPLLKMLVGAVIVPFALAQLLNVQIRLESKLYQIPVGLLSGFLGGATSMSGPPVVLFFQNRGLDKRLFRANLVAYFLLLYPVTLPAYWLGGLLTVDVVYSAALAAPAMIAGALIGARLVHRVDERLFRTITLLLVIATGVFSIVTGLGLV